MFSLYAESFREYIKDKRSSIDYSNIGKAEDWIAEKFFDEFYDEGLTEVEIGKRFDEGRIYSYVFGNVLLNEKEWGLVIKDLQDNGFTVGFKPHKDYSDVIMGVGVR